MTCSSFILCGICFAFRAKQVVLGKISVIHASRRASDEGCELFCAAPRTRWWSLSQEHESRSTNTPRHGVSSFLPENQSLLRGVLSRHSDKRRDRHIGSRFALVTRNSFRAIVPRQRV